MSLLPRYCLLLLLALLFRGTACAAPPVTIDDRGQIPLAGQLEVFFDDAGTLTLEQVIASHANDFTPLTGNLAAGFTRRTAWLRFSVHRAATAPHHWLLEIRPSYTDDLRLYSPLADGSYSERRSGDQLPFAEREIESRHPVFNLDIAAGATTYYVRAVSQNSLSLEPTLWQHRRFITAVADESLLLGLLFGVMLIAIAGNLVYLAQLREPIYLHYLLYVGLLVSMTLYISGAMYQYLLPQSPGLPDRINLANNALMLGVAFNLMWAATDLKRHMPRLFRVYRVVAWSSTVIALAAAQVFEPVQLLPWMQAVLMATLVFNIAIATPLAWRGNPGARFYLAAFGIVIIGGGLRVARNFGLLPANALTEHTFSISLLVHVIMISVLVSQQVRRFKNERNQARIEMLLAAERNEAELAARIAERTAQMTEANARFETAWAKQQQISRDQQQFLSMLSHEIRTPLAVINSAAQIAALSGLDDVGLRERQIAKIRRNVRRLADLIDVCLADDRISSDGWQIKLQPVPLAPLCDEALATARGSASDLHRFELALDGLPEFFECDRELLLIALQNLLDNAIKYSPNGGLIRLAGHIEATDLLLEVSDEGPGIPTEMRKRVFERYVRGNHGSGIPGAGLGLSLVKRIAELHGGSATANAADGSGALLRLRLPLRPASATDSTAIPADDADRALALG